MADPSAALVVEVTRGKLVESRHACAVAITDAEGGVVGHWGDIAQPIYGRSAIKPLLALGLVETGAAEAFGLGDAEIALACASHDGEPRHIATLHAWLSRVGLAVADLECGPHLPLHEPSAWALIREGREPDAGYNNCSGKHAGMLTTAVHMGEPTRGYIRFEHPVQRRLLGILEEMTGQALADAPRGIDGCGIPTIGVAIASTATAMARMADPAALPPVRAAAARRVLAAMIAEPGMVGGARQFGTQVMQATSGRVALKSGAEGVFAAAIPHRGLGVCVKALDGASRAAEVAIGEILVDLGVIEADEREKLAKRLSPPVVNRAGLEVGQIRVAADAAF
jgi:L-asparaginase II